MPGFGTGLALNDSLVGLRHGPSASSDLTVRISCRRVSSAVSLQSPNLHLTETLTAELSLTAQRLLCNQGVRTGGTGVDLIVNQVVQLEVVHVTNGYTAVELLAGAAVGKLRLAVGGEGQLCEVKACGVETQQLRPCGRRQPCPC